MGVPYRVPFAVIPTSAGVPYRIPFTVGAPTIQPVGVPYSVPFTVGSSVYNIRGHGALTATVQVKFSRPLVVSGHGVFTPTAYRSLTSIGAVLVGQGRLSATVRAKFLRPSVLMGRGTLTVTARMFRIAVAVSPIGHGVLVVVTRPKFFRSRSFPGTGRLIASARMYRILSSVAIHGGGLLSATARAKLATSPHPVGRGSLTVTAVAKKFSLVAVFQGHGSSDGSTYPPCLGRLLGTGSFTATVASFAFGLEAIQYGTGELVASSLVRFSILLIIEGSGELTITAQMGLIQSDVELSGDGNLSASTESWFSFSAMSTGIGILSATTQVLLIRSISSVFGTGTLMPLTMCRHLISLGLNGRGDLRPVAYDASISLIESVDWYNLVGSVVSVQMVQPPDDDAAEASLYLSDPLGSHRIAITWRNGDLIVTGDDDQFAVVSYNPAQHQYQRIRELAGLLHFETSGDGVFWDDTLTDIVAPDWITSLRVGLRIKSPGSVVYDNLSVPAARPVFIGDGEMSNVAYLYGLLYEIAASMEVSLRSVTGLVRTTGEGPDGQFFAMF